MPGNKGKAVGPVVDKKIKYYSKLERSPEGIMVTHTDPDPLKEVQE
jgi:hypothetical protein